MGWYRLNINMIAWSVPILLVPEEDMGETIQSMKRLLDFKTDRLVLCTSVGKIIEDGRTALEGCIDYLENLSMKARHLKDRGYTVKEIIQDIFGGEQVIRSPFFEGKP